MAEYPYLLTVEANWPSIPAKTISSKLQIYFQSKKKSHGGDCIVQYSDQNRAATIHFKSPEIRTNVLAKGDHAITISDQQLILTVRNPTDADDQTNETLKSPDAGPDVTHDKPVGLEENPNNLNTEAPPKSRSPLSTVVLEEIPHTLSREILVLLVENISDVSEEEFLLELIFESQIAVLSFRDSTVAEKFLKESKANRKFQNYGLRGRVLENTSSIKVENLSAPNNNQDVLVLYFENMSGKTVARVHMMPEEKSAVVTFKHPAVAEKILGKEHYICSTPVSVYPYFESLGVALYGKDRPKWMLPKPFTEKLHPSIRLFLHKNGLIPSICDQMASHFCQVNMDNDEVLLSPLPGLLRQKGQSRKQIESWRHNATDCFRALLSNYDVFEHEIIPSLWATVEKDIRSVVKDKAALSMDATTGVLTLAGMAQDIKLLRPILDNFLKKALNQMERAKNTTSDSMEMSQAVFSLLLQEGLQHTAADKYPDLNLNHKKETNLLMFHGLHMEIVDIKNWVLERQLKMKQKALQINLSLLEFLRSVDYEEMSQDLFTSRGINAVYRVEKEDIVLIGSSDKVLNEAEKRLHTVLAFNSLHLEDLSVLNKPELSALIAQLCDTYNLSKKKTVLIKPSKQSNRLFVSGFKEPVTEVYKTLEEFIDSHSITDEAIRVKSHAVVKFIKDKKFQSWQNFVGVKVDFDPKRPLIRLSGERKHVNLSMEALRKIADSLYIDKLIIHKAGAKKYFQEQGNVFLMMMKEHTFVVVLEDSDLLMDEGEDDYDDGGTEDFGQLSCEVQMPGRVITVRKADICQFKVDAVVNAANEDLKHIGGVALALLRAAGPRLQECSDQYVAANGPLPTGRAIITEAGQLPCKYVVHAVGPRYTATDEFMGVKRLRQAVRESLNQAVHKHCSSIAIPVISSGVFGFPLELCTDTIAKELRAYVEDRRRQGDSIMPREIHMVDNNASTVNAMAQAVMKHFADFNPKVAFPQQMGSHRRGTRSRGSRGKQGQIYRGGQGNQEKSSRGQHEHGHRGFGTRSEEPHIYRANESVAFEHQVQSRKQHSDSRSGDLNRSGLLETQSTPEGIRIILKKGNIQDSFSDVIVNTISEDLDLSKGAVSNALLQAAGPQLQADAKAHLARSGYPGLNYGDIVVTDGHNLNCQKVFHTVCPFWKGGANSEDEVLKQIIATCLKKAENQKMASISFPAIGTGNLGFPKNLVSSVLLGQIHTFSARVTPQYIKEVTVTVHPSDSETVQCFITSFRGGNLGPVAKGAQSIQQSPARKAADPTRSSQSAGLFGVVSTPSLGVHSVQVGNLTLEVSSGDITREKSDAIVNSSNQSFSLKAGVSKAILDGAGLAVEQECAQIVNASGHQPKVMIVTSGGQLPCRNIIHIIGRNNPVDIKDAVYSVLKLCEDKKFSSVSFPALGTGQGGASPSAVADAMIDAVADFVRKKKGVHLRSVKFMIFQTSMLPEFHRSMLKKREENAGEESTVIDWIKDKIDHVTNFFRGEATVRPANEEFVMVGEEFEPAVFQLCGETQQDVSQAKDLITSLIVKEQTSSTIQDSVISSFTREDADALSALQRELMVSIRLVKSGPEPVIGVEGLTRDVLKAENQIRDMIRKVEKNETRRREAFILGSIVEWQYVDSKNSLVKFDLLTNYDLEKAFIQKVPHLKIKISNEEYDADITRNIAVGKGRQIHLKRTDCRDKSSVSFPKTWDDMKGSLILEVQIQEGTQEFTDVENEFMKTGMVAKILEIKRIQNSTLWSNYTIQKQHVDTKNNHTNNEKRLFHGTGPDCVDKIIHHGFNRSYAGTHGAMYGNGVYFAVDPAYSAQGYSKPDRQGQKRMFLARVLVGEYTRGKNGLLAPPAKSSTGIDLYDSVTDNQKIPSMFVIFHDVQAYPEYLITFL